MGVKKEVGVKYFSFNWKFLYFPLMFICDDKDTNKQTNRQTNKQTEKRRKYIVH